MMIAWPSMMRLSDGRKPSKVKYISAASPKATPGRIIGDMNIVSSMRAHCRPLRAIASDAAVPKSVARAVAQSATSRLLLAARWICRERAASNSSAYHSSENPVGGNFSERLSVKEVMRTIRTGPTRIKIAIVASAPTTSE